ncbi:nitrogen fixation negative regulator NifL [Aestuariirhabdus litorea]|uniref:histidine kinase n=1 Tax=Aestuariirhabdus litorea TaxID=2528527 RepID=A0A3P3VKS6_9GAMM|nr:nitrogen fixation negative regulator NifL [Aestuariirhabdus litorea]RRJ82907.1 nitrogen fixation negative regulator NifL [Aestuariirhabdus litorea]RWW93066.1 nitrogen fixation negative regulator NifL [Endozoicomonadaceae bacterium GTF-13]
MSKAQVFDSREATRLPSGVYFQTVDQSPVAITITDPESRILYTNAAFTQVTGYEAGDVRGQHTRILSAGKTPACLYGELWSTLTRQQVWSGRLVNRRKDDSIYLAELTITPVIDSEGNTTHYLGMHRDITRLQKLSQELENQRTLTDSIVRGSPVATLLLDNEGRVRFENPALEQLCLTLGCDSEQLLVLLSRRLGLDYRQCGDFTDLEVRCDIPGIGTPRWLSCSGSSLRLWQSDDSFHHEQGHDCLLLTVNDITDLKIQQEEVRINALMARLAENELVHSMREALNGAIFQLQRPLNVTGAAAALQKRRNGDKDPLHQALHEVLESCQLAIDTLSQALPPQPPIHKMPLNLNELLREVLSLYTERLLSEGVVVDWKPCNSLPSVLGDEISLCNLFKQLLDNALTAMAHAHTRDRELRICSQRLEDAVRVTIADNGPGIDDTLRNKVFQPFFTTYQEDGNRSGMGLVLVQDVANEHGVSIDIDQSTGGGCQFSLTFPALAGH